MYIIFTNEYADYCTRSWAIEIIEDSSIKYYTEVYEHPHGIHYKEVDKFNASDILGIGYAILHKNVKISDVL